MGMRCRVAALAAMVLALASSANAQTAEERAAALAIQQATMAATIAADRARVAAVTTHPFKRPPAQ